MRLNDNVLEIIWERVVRSFLISQVEAEVEEHDEDDGEGRTICLVQWSLLD